MDPIASLQQLHRKHTQFLSDFTTEMVTFFSKMKNFYAEEEKKRIHIFQQQKQEITRLVMAKRNQQEQNYQKVSKKQAKKQKSDRKKAERQLKSQLKAPKAPHTAYFMFFMDCQQKIKEDFPQCPMVDMAKMAGKLWKQLEDQDKQFYLQKYQRQKKQYENDQKEYKERRNKWNQERIEQQKWAKAMKKTSDFNQPKENQQKQLQSRQNHENQKLIQLSCSQSSQQWGSPAIERQKLFFSKVQGNQSQNAQALNQKTSQGVWILQKLRQQSQFCVKNTKKQQQSVYKAILQQPSIQMEKPNDLQTKINQIEIPSIQNEEDLSQQYSISI